MEMDPADIFDVSNFYLYKQYNDFSVLLRSKIIDLNFRHASLIIS